jgi:hypothetical protein
MVGSMAKNELYRIWKEAIAAQTRNYPYIRLEELRNDLE